MWPMTDAEAILFIITVALLVALAQVAGGWPSHHTAGSPAVSGTAMMVSNSTKARLAGQGPGL